MNAVIQTEDIQFMKQALEQAKQAELLGEVPVGAIVIVDGKVIAKAHNQPIGLNNPCAHAEVLALGHAGKFLNNYRLNQATLYVTLEPCMMCVGAMVHARIARCVYGATDPRTGACQSQAQLFNSAWLNHQVSYQGGVLADQCSALIQDFFQKKRK